MMAKMPSFVNDTSSADNQNSGMQEKPASLYCDGNGSPNTETDGSRLSVLAKQPLDFLTRTDERNFTVTNSDIVWTVVSILSRIVSILLNINLAYDYYRKGKVDYFIWTTCGIVVPGIVTSTLTVYMYLEDMKEHKKVRKRCCEILIFIIIVPLFFRYCQSLAYAIQSKIAEARNDRDAQKKYYEFMIQEDSDVALVRIFECLLEAAPQKILQLTIVLSGEDRITWPQLLAIFGAITGIAWCMASYYRCIRFSQPDKRHMSWLGTISQILWHFFVTMSRILAIATVASIFPKYMLIACFAHSFTMTLWIFFFDRSPFCSSTMLHSFLFSLVLGVVFIFTYILPRVGRTFYRYLIYYSLCGVENLVCVVIYLCYVQNATIRESFYLPLLAAAPIAPFAIGILSMVCYYKNFHPNIMSRKQQEDASSVSAGSGSATGEESQPQSAVNGVTKETSGVANAKDSGCE
ncbi:XK-related protein 6 [Aedes aegypti]|uniref:XK-related protein n=1 Tax=Aedes aegypti TaxID=7159 RepID=A0A6I8TTV3_AEDAE|nr:XK-related protein 6 [Aedes aegypti]